MRLKPAQLAVIAVALGAGILAAMLMGGRPTPQIVQQAAPEQQPDMRLVDVLVARGEIPTGKVLTAADLEWRRWPEDATSQHFVSRRSGDNNDQALNEQVGAIARTAFVQGEPIRPNKLIRGTSGYMSAILTPGMRAIAAPIDDPSRGAGAFILPNDRVDVILARRTNAPNNTADGITHQTATVLRNIRVLAVDQTVEQRNDKTIVARTATLELTPNQAETLALARELGTLSLSLRSLADAAASNLAGEAGSEGDGLNNPRDSRLTIVRFGVPTSTSARGGE